MTRPQPTHADAERAENMRALLQAAVQRDGLARACRAVRTCLTSVGDTLDQNEAIRISLELIDDALGEYTPRLTPPITPNP